MAPPTSLCIDPPTPIAASLRALLDSEGLKKVNTCDVIVVARAGSQMYNLALPISDTDYIIVYKEPTEVGGALESIIILLNFLSILFSL